MTLPVGTTAWVDYKFDHGCWRSSGTHGAKKLLGSRAPIVPTESGLPGWYILPTRCSYGT